jgi:hypothetical protein
MNTFKTIVAATFLGGFICGCVGLIGGLIGGLIVPVYLWPSSNLGPFIGVIYALPAGAVVGSAIGFGVGIVRILVARRRRRI